MKRLVVTAGVVCALATFPVLAQGQDAGVKKPTATGTADAGTTGQVTATAELKNQKGKKVGTATLRQTPNGVVITLKTSGLPAGEHAMHIHETGKCEAPFKTAGGHFNPKGHQHGIENPKGKHAGDLPNLHLPKRGELQVTVFTDGVTLTPGASSVFDADGSAIVIHAGKDDYTTDPTGDAGDRIACGVIQKQ